MESVKEVVIRRAHADDAQALSELAFRSKAYWGYSDEFMEACRDELTVTTTYIAGNATFVAEVDGRIAGFAALVHEDAHRVELSNLFVEPWAIGTGVGKTLMSHTTQSARDQGYVTMVIDADPNAEPFYRHLGAIPAGTSPSGSIPGRELPRLELALRRER